MTKLKALDPLLHPIQDMLHKETQFVDNLTNLIKNSIVPPYTIALDGSWGTGKTTIMIEAYKYLSGNINKYPHDNESCLDYPVFWFNPWEYHKTPDVVLAFLQCLAQTYPDKVKNLKNSEAKILEVLLNSGINAFLKIYTKGNISLKEIKEEFNGIEKKQKTVSDNYENVIELIKKEFVELIISISEDHNNNPVIFFFDDLDRCLPDNAINLLEAMKNLFVVPKSNCIFICGIDTRVAKKFIVKYYRGMKDQFAVNYFRKIFNLSVSMPYTPSVIQLLEEDIIPDTIKVNKEDAALLARIIYSRGRNANITSIRKYTNILYNYFVFFEFNKNYQFEGESDLIIILLIFKESWQSLYEVMIEMALKRRSDTVYDVLNNLLEHKHISIEQKEFIKNWILEKKLNHLDEKFEKILSEYPTLA